MRVVIMSIHQHNDEKGGRPPPEGCPAFEELRDKNEFIQFGLDQTIFWKNGADIAPERLYELGVAA